MFDKALAFVAPHICCGCGKVGRVLCEHCINDIISHSFTACLACLRPVSVGNICHVCKTKVTFQEAWVVGPRSGALLELIDLYKFERAIESSNICARLLDDSLPFLPADAIVTYVPTISSHIRQRGYDHMERIAKEFAKLRGLEMRQLLQRTTSLSQRGLSRQQRLLQQQGSFKVLRETNSPVLIIDDIYTTGGTVNAAVQALKSSSNRDVYVAVLARQPLEETSDL